MERARVRSTPYGCTPGLLLPGGRCELDTPGYGVRSDECLGYIARIVSSFEIVALQEVRGEYNQMALLPGGPLQYTGRAGVLDYYESVYRSRWRTFQMSDHLPMWMELKVP